jgi:hypothetical protein
VVAFGVDERHFVFFVEPVGPFLHRVVVSIFRRLECIVGDVNHVLDAGGV